MMLTLFDLPALPIDEAVAAAASLAPAEPRAWEALDRVLRGGVVRFLQEREGDADALAGALFSAGRSAGGSWQERWFYLMELLRDGQEHPAVAASVRLLSADQWAGRVLRVIAERPPTARKAIKERFGDELTESHLSNLLVELQGAGLIRKSRSGRETTLLLLPEGRRIARLLAAPAEGVPVRAPSRPRSPTVWNTPPVEERFD